MKLTTNMVGEYLKYKSWDDILEEHSYYSGVSNLITDATSTNAKSYEAEIERERNSKMKTNKKGDTQIA
mgnify:CR=1 FL=1